MNNIFSELGSYDAFFKNSSNTQNSTSNAAPKRNGGSSNSSSNKEETIGLKRRNDIPLENKNKIKKVKHEDAEYDDDYGAALMGVPLAKEDEEEIDEEEEDQYLDIEKKNKEFKERLGKLMDTSMIETKTDKKASNAKKIEWTSGKKNPSLVSRLNDAMGKRCDLNDTALFSTPVISVSQSTENQNQLPENSVLVFVKEVSHKFGQINIEVKVVQNNSSDVSFTKDSTFTFKFGTRSASTQDKISPNGYYVLSDPRRFPVSEKSKTSQVNQAMCSKILQYQ